MKYFFVETVLFRSRLDLKTSYIKLGHPSSVNSGHSPWGNPDDNDSGLDCTQLNLLVKPFFGNKFSTYIYLE